MLYYLSVGRIVFMKKLCVYTCITGDYDNVNNFSCGKDNNVDYYLFTNNKTIRSDFWNVIYIENDGLDNIRLARKIKILGHDILKEYDITVWVDGASYPKKSILEFIDKFCDLDKYSLIGFKHPERDCIYDEGKVCVIAGKESKDNVIEQMIFLKSKNYPRHNGLIESAILVRNIKDNNLIRTMELWFEMVKNYSYRDQLSFNYAAYVNNLNYFLLDMKAFDNEYFGRLGHCSKKENRLKKYRIYLGDDTDLELYDYNCDYSGFYDIKDNKFIIEILPSVNGNLLKLKLDNFGGIKVKSVKVLNRKSEDLQIEVVASTIYRDIDVIVGDNPTVLIKTNYYKGRKLKIEIEMEFLEEYEYREIIDLLYYQINGLNNELSNLKKGNDNLKEVYLKIIDSKSWTTISLFRNSYNNLKNKLKKGVDNEKK